MSARAIARSGNVFFKDILAGVIEQSVDGDYSFQYAPEYLRSPNARPISLSMPLQEQPYSSRVLFPFFDGLIPEGWLLTIAVDKWKLDPRDRLGLLLTVCRDCIGAVHVEGVKL